MLVLSRKPGEEILIGHDIRLVVHRIAGNRVTFGIVAPRSVRVLRGELRVRAAPSENKMTQGSPAPAG
jgi:carbon storage regulator